MTMKRPGFTIVEAVVIVAVLLILAAILFPVFARRPRTGRYPSCQSMLKQIALGYKQYIQDYKEAYPRARSGDAFANNNIWPDALIPYVKNQQVFQCPSDTNAIGPEFISYGYNSNLSSKNEAKMNNSAVIILNYEVTGSEIATCGNKVAAVTAPTRHLEGSNYSFVGGHVKWFKPGKVSDTATNSSTPSFVVH
jgi:prepilin-type processing-associated H-X9-DG protein